MRSCRALELLKLIQKYARLESTGIPRKKYPSARINGSGAEKLS